MLGSMIKEELTRDLRSKIGAALSTRAITRFRKRVDYTEFGGAPLLGIDGEAIICHGRSPAKAIKNAVRVAGEWAKKGLNEHIRAALEAEVARGGREGGRERSGPRSPGSGRTRPSASSPKPTSRRWSTPATGGSCSEMASPSAASLTK